MRRISLYRPGNSTVLIVATPVGSYNEPKGLEGIAHVVEHMVFKGSKHQKSNEFSQWVLHHGGSINACTDWDFTAYYCEVANEYKDQALLKLMDMVITPKFPKKDWETERGVITQELRREQEQQKSLSLYMSSRYVDRLATSQVGTLKSLRNITTSDLKAYHNKHYTMDNMVVIEIGDVVDNAMNTPSYFKHTPLSPSAVHIGDIRRNTHAAQAQVRFGGICSKTPDIFTSALFMSIYDDMDGRLFNVIREKHGLAYMVNLNILTKGNNAEWIASIGTDKSKVNKARELIIKELARPITNKEIQNAITKCTGQLSLQFNDKEVLGFTILDQLINQEDYRQVIYAEKLKANLEKAANEALVFQKSINTKDILTVVVY